jgi:hypothetical protein
MRLLHKVPIDSPNCLVPGSSWFNRVCIRIESLWCSHWSHPVADLRCTIWWLDCAKFTPDGSDSHPPVFLAGRACTELPDLIYLVYTLNKLRCFAVQKAATNTQSTPDHLHKLAHHKSWFNCWSIPAPCLRPVPAVNQAVKNRPKPRKEKGGWILMHGLTLIQTRTFHFWGIESPIIGMQIHIALPDFLDTLCILS